MASVRKQAKRENRILFEIVVDTYDEIERAMGWYCYLQDNLHMPFKVRSRSVHATSPLDIGSEAEVIELADEDECMSEICVVVEYGEFQETVPLAELECVSADADTLQAVADWHYWVARGYQY